MNTNSESPCIVDDLQAVHRSSLERYRDVLKVVAGFGPVRQTHIMYKAG